MVWCSDCVVCEVPGVAPGLQLLFGLRVSGPGTVASRQGIGMLDAVPQIAWFAML